MGLLTHILIYADIYTQGFTSSKYPTAHPLRLKVHLFGLPVVVIPAHCAKAGVHQK